MCTQCKIREKQNDTIFEIIFVTIIRRLMKMLKQKL